MAWGYMRAQAGGGYKEIIAVGSRNNYYSRVVYKNKNGFNVPEYQSGSGAYTTDYVTIEPTGQKIVAVKKCRISAIIANGPEVGPQHKQAEIAEKVVEPGEVVYSFTGNSSNYFGILILVR